LFVRQSDSTLMNGHVTDRLLKRYYGAVMEIWSGLLDIPQ
jgi:hypothetical protein